jgi:hypothetical protein
MNRLKVYSTLHDVFSGIYICGSFIIVPYLSYLWGDWWLLFGITFWWFGIFLASGKYKILFFIPFLLLFYWFQEGFSFHQRVTFFCTWLVLGYLLILIAYKYKKLYNQALRNKLIVQFVFDYGDMNYVSKEILPYIVSEINDFIKQNPDTLITRDFIDAFCASSITIYLTNKAQHEQL